MSKTLPSFILKYREQMLYLFFGALTTFLNLFVFWLASKICTPLIANIIAWIAGVIFAYVTNRIWVFSSNNEAIGKECASFFAGRIATLGMEEFILWLGISILNINALIIKVITQILVIIGNYVISKWVVFSK